VSAHPTPQRQAFRAWVRLHHPDVDGDPEEFIAGLSRWRTAVAGARCSEGVRVSVFRSRGGLWLAARWWRRHRRRRVRRVR
jgi:hypothetical protein